MRMVFARRVRPQSPVGCNWVSFHDQYYDYEAALPAPQSVWSAPRERATSLGVFPRSVAGIYSLAFWYHPSSGHWDQSESPTHYPDEEAGP